MVEIGMNNFHMHYGHIIQVLGLQLGKLLFHLSTEMRL